MSKRKYGQAAAVVALAILLALLATACGGGSGDSTRSETTKGGEAEGTTSTMAKEQVIAPYVGQPSPFPVTEKLKAVPTGAKFVWAESGTPVDAVFGQLADAAGKTMGVDLKRVKVGTSASSVSSGFDTIVAMKPDAVLVPSLNVELWSKQLKQLQEANVPVVTAGVTGAEKYGIVTPQIAENYSKLSGKLMANYVVAEMNPKANAAIYEVPELPFTSIMAEEFVAQIEAVCPECSARIVQIPVATIGNTAPTAIVSDLQANPETDVVVFPADSAQNGLAPALQEAGIEVETLGGGPGPENLQSVKEGKETDVLAGDLGVMVWSMVDQAARELAGQELKGLQAEGLGIDMQFLTQRDITFDPSKGWSGYPDFPERFAELWGVQN